MYILSLLPITVGYFLGVIGYLFFYWRRLKEDYQPNIIFSTAFIQLIGIAIVSLVSYLVLRNLSYVFWIAIVFYLVIFTFVRRKYRLRGFEAFEASSIGLLFIVFISSVVIFISNLNILNGLIALLPVLSAFAFIFFDSRYKRFSWYKSGRVGFAGLASLLIYFLIRCVIVVIAPSSMISFSGNIVLGKYDIGLSALAIALLLFTIYWLAKE